VWEIEKWFQWVQEKALHLVRQSVPMTESEKVLCWASLSVKQSEQVSGHWKESETAKQWEQETALL
jgi:hypothetical protein